MIVLVYYRKPSSNISGSFSVLSIGLIIASHTLIIWKYTEKEILRLNYQKAIVTNLAPMISLFGSVLNKNKLFNPNPSPLMDRLIYGLGITVQSKTHPG